MSDNSLNRDNIDIILKELAKEIKKRCGRNTSAEIILIGGASILINYGFREMTYDVDAIVNATSSMKDAINYIGDKYMLPKGWLNTDFIHTESYSPKILEFSTYYRTYSNTISFRTITGEYLIAMKLRSARKYKYDRSDIVGILMEQEALGDSITLGRIKKAVKDLYGSYNILDAEIRHFIEGVMIEGNYKGIYDQIRKNEEETKNILLEYQRIRPRSLNSDNVNEIIDILLKRKDKDNQ
ncbi:MAG: hypothetical protein J6U23_14270 [Clostridiales bacterium]|nr:hypothetical protein [Clostridiales bacterium]